MTLKLAKRIVSCAIIGTAVLSLVVTYDTNRANAALNKRLKEVSKLEIEEKKKKQEAKLQE